jgi:hypothetical protein
VASIYSDNFDVLITTTLDKVRPSLTDQITTENVLLAWLNANSRVTVDGGTVIRRPLIFAFNDTVGSYSGYDLIDVTPQEGIGWAEYPWKQHAGSVVISGEEVEKNDGTAQLINLLQAKLDQLKMSTADDLNAMLFADGTGNSSKDMLGLKALVLNSGTVGEIAQSTYTWWASVVGASTLDITTLDGVRVMNNMYNSLRINRSKVDIELTTQAIYEAYEELALPNLRFNDTRMADLGFESVNHKGASVVFDPDCDSGRLYMLNSDRLEFVQKAGRWLDVTDFQRPYNQDAKVALILSMGNLITDCRRAHGLFTGVTSS